MAAICTATASDNVFTNMLLSQIVIMNNEMRPKKSIVARNGAQVSLTGQGYLGGPQGLMITIL